MKYKDVSLGEGLKQKIELAHFTPPPFFFQCQHCNLKGKKGVNYLDNKENVAKFHTYTELFKMSCVHNRSEIAEWGFTS